MGKLVSYTLYKIQIQQRSISGICGSSGIQVSATWSNRTMGGWVAREHDQETRKRLRRRDVQRRCDAITFSLQQKNMLTCDYTSIQNYNVSENPNLKKLVDLAYSLHGGISMEVTKTRRVRRRRPQRETVMEVTKTRRVGKRRT